VGYFEILPVQRSISRIFPVAFPNSESQQIQHLFFNMPVLTHIGIIMDMPGRVEIELNNAVILHIRISRNILNFISTPQIFAPTTFAA